MRAHLPVVVSTLLLMAGLATSAMHAAPLPHAPRPNVFSTIQGNALNSANGPLPNNVVRLRDARAGRIIDTQTTDRSGLFSFRTIDPGSYIVELVGPAQAILSASQILNVDAGQAVSAVVKLPFHISPLSGVLGHTVPSAAAVSSAAASSGVMAVTVAGEPISPQ